MADKRAMDRKWVAEPYDMDTALGINNSGILSYGYSLEDTDQVDAEIAGGDDQGSKDVFNAQNSVLWMNIRDAYRDQIVNMYMSLRSGDKFNYSYIEHYIENHQSKWPEALVNEDSYVKYITPLVKPVTEKKDEVTGETYYVTTSEYLTKLLGLKTQQRRRWLYNRFRYIDSKYLLGDAAANTIGMRLFHDGTLTVTPALDLYVSVRFGLGSTPRQVRATAGTPIDFAFVNPSGTKDMETVIYSADLITDLGDLSVFYPNEINLSFATRLRRLKIGSGEEGYSNGRLNTINISNKPVLEYLDLRNCPNLAEGFDLEGSPRLEEAYFDGTAITGVDLAEGCSIEHLHLPGTITALTLMDLDKLTDLQLAGLSKVERCMIRNVSPSVADPISIVEQLQPGTLVYLEGINVELADAAAIDEFMDFLDTMKGVTRTRGSNGRWAYTETEKAQVSGKIHTDSLTGADIITFKERYPYINIEADHLTATVYFHNWERDSGIAYTTTVLDGGNSADPGTLTHDPTPANTFEFIGWSRTPQSTVVDADALKNVTSDRHVYAVYQLTGKTFTVTFRRTKSTNSTIDVTVKNVPYGTDVDDSNIPKTMPDEPYLEFMQWDPEPTDVQSDLICLAIFRDTRENEVAQFIDGTIRVFDDDDELSFDDAGALIVGNTFNMCNELQLIDLKAITIIPYSFAKGCAKLIKVNIPSAVKIGSEAFSGCGRLQSINAPLVTEIQSSAFYTCTNLKKLNFPSVTEIGQTSFYRCSNLESISIPSAVTIGSDVFNSCAKLTEVVLRDIKTIGTSAFSGASKLQIIDLQNVETINKDAFNGCSLLTAVIIRNTVSVVTLTNSTFINSANNVYFYVPDNLVEDYKTYTNWSTHADRIKGLSEVPV